MEIQTRTKNRQKQLQSYIKDSLKRKKGDNSINKKLFFEQELQ